MKWRLFWKTEYGTAGIDINWVVVDGTKKHVREDKRFFLKRYAFNESKKRSLLVINWDGTAVSRYKTDQTEYLYRGSRIVPADFSATYEEQGGIRGLEVVNGELEIRSFEVRYEKWLQRKQGAFQKAVLDYENRIEAGKRAGQPWKGRKCFGLTGRTACLEKQWMKNCMTD